MSEKPIVLIPAAGVSRRFAEAGYAGHKALLQVEYKGQIRTGFEWLRATLPTEWETYVGVRNADVVPFCGLGKVSGAILGLGQATGGQASSISAMLELAVLPEEDPPIVVVNCDVLPLRTPEAMLREMTSYGASCCVSVAKSMSPAMSYVDGAPTFRVAAEKSVISSWALTGVYCFRSARELRAALRLSKDETTNGETYLSAALRHLPGPRRANASLMVVDWGTPEAVIASGARIVERLTEESA